MVARYSISMRTLMFSATITLILSACGGGGGSAAGPPPGPTPTPIPSATPTPNPQASFYEPLALGDSWSYTCRDIKGGGENGGQAFSIMDSVVGATSVNGQAVYEFSLQVPQVPSSPLSVLTQVQLLANDAQGNVTLYGYLVNGSVQSVTPTVIVTASPSQQSSYNYPALGGGTISRVFAGFFPSNPTPLGVFPALADYEESGATNNYGYARGTGIAEEDHGPNNEVDCLISAVTLH